MGVVTMRMNVNCVVDAKNEYMRHFVAKISPALVEVIQDLVADAKLVASADAMELEEIMTLMFEEIPEWPAKIVEARVVHKLRAHCPNYMGIFEKIFLASGIILNTVHSSEQKATPHVEIPSEIDVARILMEAIGSELADKPELALESPSKAIKASQDALRDAILRTIPVDDIVEADKQAARVTEKREDSESDTESEAESVSDDEHEEEVEIQGDAESMKAHQCNVCEADAGKRTITIEQEQNNSDW